MPNDVRYEIRNIDGISVFVVDIGDSLWLFNDVFVCFCDGRPVTDAVVLSFLDAKDDPICPYGGAENGCVLVQCKSRTNGKYFWGEYPLGSLNDKALALKAERAFAAYRKWSGISNA